MFPRYDELLKGVPEYERYPTLEEYEQEIERLAASPHVARREIGRSRDGRPISCLEVGDGPLHAVLVGAPHPEELAGTLLLTHLVPLLAESELASQLGFRFSIVPVADPDGMALNGAWVREPHDLEGFLTRAYRPALSEQFEWTFPIEYKRFAFTRPLPEGRAVMQVVDAGPVDLFMGLHNEHVAGAYVYLSHDDEALRERVAATLAETELPAHRAEPETVPSVHELGPGAFAAFALPDEYEYHDLHGADPAAVLDHGTAADHYAETVWDCFTLVAEVPYFTTVKAADVSPGGLSRREARLRGVDLEDGYRQWLWERYLTVAEALTGTTPWQRSVHDYLATARDTLRAERRQVEQGPEFEAEATVAQVLDSIHLRELRTLAHLGRFAMMLAAEPASDERLDEAGAEALARIHARVPQLAAAAAVRPVPLRRLVQAQFAVLLYGLEAVRERYRPAHPRPEGRRAAP
jgi:hypothetical protein